MTWTKLGDEFADETSDLSSDAFRLHVEALIWSNKKLADLIVPKRKLPRLTAVDHPYDTAEELIVSGWWQDVGDSYYIGCRFADWQVERSVIEHQRSQAVERTRRHRMRRAGDHSLCGDKCSVTRDATRDSVRDATRSTGTGLDGSERENKGLEEEEGGLGDDRSSSWPAVIPPGSANSR